MYTNSIAMSDVDIISSSYSSIRPMCSSNNVPS